MHMNKHNKISAIVISYNEEKVIADCLQSLFWCDEIIVIDSYSTDNTINFAKKYTDSVFQKKWEGYSIQKNYGMELAKNDWLLFIDSDEIVTDDLAKEISNIMTCPEYMGYYIPRKNYLLGVQLKYSGQYPQYSVRLFNRKYGKWEDREVHEQVLIKEKLGYIKNPIDHINDFEKETLYGMLLKEVRFSKLELADRKKNNKNKLRFSEININMFLKHYSVSLPFQSIFKFFYIYIVKLGFLDGKIGLLWAIYHGFLPPLLTTTFKWEEKIKSTKKMIK